jgi:hypothetical protein
MTKNTAQGLQSRQIKGNLACINRELKRLKTQISALEERKQKLATANQ